MDALTGYVDALRARSARPSRSAVLAGVAVGATVASLQTAASIDNLAVSAYSMVLDLPAARTGPAAVVAIVTAARQHHADHAQAFNAAAVKAGGAPQTNPDPLHLAAVRAAMPTTLVEAVALLVTLEDLAAETYAHDAATAATADLRTLLLSVAAVEAQHGAALRAAQALLVAGRTREVLPAALARLPRTAGSAGLPDAFTPAAGAAATGEGAVG